ncbi:MAG: hypothetical protein IJX99_08660 [Clostridia bacterium]|nr:hypothetical protein [Clostridia bacterium]
MNYPMIDWNDKASLEEKVHAIYNILNTISKEMFSGRVPQNKKELQNNISESEEKLSAPLSIAFVKMVENEEIDEITASEYSNLFLEWTEKSSFNINEIRQRNGKLYKCLQAHTSQIGWEPENASSLWKLLKGFDENGIQIWSQPITQLDAFMLNDITSHNGKIWTSDYDYNVWEPGIFGWHVKEETIETPNSGDN